MSRGLGPDPQEQRRQAEANLLMLRVGLALIDEARRLGAFETDQEKLDERIAELTDELGGGVLADDSADQALVRATAQAADRIGLSAAYGESSSVEATLRADGVLLEEFVTGSVQAVQIDEAELSSEELEEMRKVVAEFTARQARPQFGGERFLRALAAQPQLGAEVQILAAELFDDGLLVHYTFDRERESLESIDFSKWHDTDPELKVEDDLETEYYESGGSGSGGVQVAHGALGFAPAVPRDAQALRISTGSGTVELPL